MARGLLKAAALGVAMASAASVAQAQDVVPTQGVSVGLDLTYANQKVDDLSGSGMGVGVRLGYGIGRMFEPYLNLSTTKVDVDGGDYGLGQFDFGTRINFNRAGSRLVPFADVALSVRGIATDLEGDPTLGSGELEASSTAFTLGGGARYFFSPKWAFDGALQYTVGKYGDWKFNGNDLGGEDVDGNAFRLNVGISWHPMAR